MTLLEFYIIIFIGEAIASTLATIYLWRLHRRTRSTLSSFFAIGGTLLALASDVLGVAAALRLAGRPDVAILLTPFTIPALLALGAATPALALFLWWLGRNR